jgi:hypothetical protein
MEDNILLQILKEDPDIEDAEERDHCRDCRPYRYER